MLPNDINIQVSMINMKLRDDDFALSHVLDIYDIEMEGFLKRLEENGYFYDEDINQIKAK